MRITTDWPSFSRQLARNLGEEVSAEEKEQLLIHQQKCYILLQRNTDDYVFDDFPKISDHFPSISEYSSKLARRSHESRMNISRKIFEDFEEDPTLFRSYVNEFKYNLTD